MRFLGLLVVFFIIGGVLWYFFTQQYSGKFCGGIAAIPCPVGYVCKLEGSYPDASGSCQGQFNP